MMKSGATDARQTHDLKLDRMPSHTHNGLLASHRRRTAIFIQFSDLCLTHDPGTRDYYSRSYARMTGYNLPSHFMEIPYWIPTVASMLPDHAYEKELMIVEDVPRACRDLMRRVDDPILFMSVMDASLTQSHQVISVGLKTIIGGYTDPADFEDLANVTYCHDINDLSGILDHVIPSPSCLDYRLFEGFACIPRLSLSSGCSFRCSFCTVPTQLVPATEERLLADVDALAGLSYGLIFIDDKSFGQAQNWQVVARVRDIICNRTDEFYGFIVQTPPSIAARPGFLEACYELGVRYVEFGVETVDDALLKWLRKPFSIGHLRQACSIARDLGMYIIPNLIIGIPGDDYSGSIVWLKDNVDIIPVVNVNWLSVHHGNDRGSLDLPDHGIADRDQNTSNKTWLSPSEEARGHLAIAQCYGITDSYWRGRSIDLQPLAMARS